MAAYDKLADHAGDAQQQDKQDIEQDEGGAGMCAITPFTFVNLESGREIHRLLPWPEITQPWRA